MAGVLHGVNNKKPDAGQCMVVGCERRAIYRGDTQVKNRDKTRGYCSQHKAFAGPQRGPNATDTALQEWLLRRVGEG